jgi:2-hydroxy-6-oxonona-2,4-dienedioate hydrolase
LDAGCGNGYMSKEFSKLVNNTGKVYTLDSEKEAIERLKEKTKGPMPLVMLHGLFGGPENWESTIPYLPKTCLPVVMLFRFFDEDRNLSSLSALTDYAQQYLDELAYDPMVLMGNSLGGHIAILLTLRMPERVQGLVLSGSSGLFERSFTRVPGTKPPRHWVHAKTCEVFYNQSHVTDTLVDTVMGVISDRSKVRILLRLAKSAKRHNIRSKLRLIHCPTLLICGRQDKITPPVVADSFHKSIPNSSLAWIDECGHAPMIERPLEFASHLGSWWLEKLRPSV